ncbi:hypothetical protein SDC9_68286 [bioreactor metagenome]|uniref:Uncharacterized protein n=1 Tax=bioreactor metagenome TaxID=1076179 RepID=A0A644Y007_9ZZZZ
MAKRAFYCPQCKANFNVESYYNKLGSPLRKCPGCLNTYYDTSVREPALMSPSDFLPKTIGAIAWCILISFAIGSAVALIAVGSISFDVFLKAGSAVFLIYVLVLRPWDYRDEINASLERLKDEKYLNALKKYGKCDIAPDSAYLKFINSDKNYV